MAGFISEGVDDDDSPLADANIDKYWVQFGLLSSHSYTDLTHTAFRG